MLPPSAVSPRAFSARVAPRLRRSARLAARAADLNPTSGSRQDLREPGSVAGCACPRRERTGGIAHTGGTARLMAFLRSISRPEAAPLILGDGVCLRGPQMGDHAEWAALRERSRAF